MINVIEKKGPTEADIIDITSDSPFEKGPCIIMIPPVTKRLSQLNRYFDIVLKLLNPDEEYTYDPNRRILGLSYGEYDEANDEFTRITPVEKEVKQFVNKCVSPLFMENGEKIDVLESMKRFRNLNFLAYCNGGLIYLLIEKKIEEKMHKVGYSDEDIKLIMSQVCFIEVAGNCLKKYKTSSLAIAFGDINDNVFGEGIDNKEKIENESEGLLRYAPYQYKSSLAYAVNGEGVHRFDTSVLEIPTLNSKLRALLQTSLNNALENQNNVIIDPITIKKVSDALNDGSNEHTRHI